MKKYLLIYRISSIFLALKYQHGKKHPNSIDTKSL